MDVELGCCNKASWFIYRKRSISWPQHWVLPSIWCVLGIKLLNYLPQYYAQSKGMRFTIGVLVTFFTSWNLEFFRLLLPPFCISESISNLQVLCMEYIVAFIPLILTVIMYVCFQQHARGNRVLICLWKPFEFCLTPLSRRYNWNPMESIVNALHPS